MKPTISKTPNPKPKKTISLNVARKHYLDTKYQVVRFVGKKLLNWQLTKNEKAWEVMWVDSTVPPELLASMKPYQRVNHFPGMYAIARKSNLCMNLNKLRNRFPEDFNFYPKTWFLPAEHSEFHKNFKAHSTYIVKPEASSQGKGIYLTRDINEIEPGEHCIVQEYLSRPFLIEGLKFDLRIYVLVTGCNPLRLFIHEEGLTRFATEKYKKPSSANIEQMRMHLTNYAVNRKSKKFVANKNADEDSVGHKRSLSSTFIWLEENGYDVDTLWDDICDIIIKTICAIQPSLAHTYHSCQPDDVTNAMCFEILGFDIILDDRLRPWLLEVNHSPAFSTGSPLDKKVKRQVIKEALEMLNLSPSDKKKYELQRRKEITLRTIQKTSFQERSMQKEHKRKEFQHSRDEYESENSGGYIKIFPGKNDNYYLEFMEAAKEIWSNFTGSRNRSRRVSQKEEKKKSESRDNFEKKQKELYDFYKMKYTEKKDELSKAYESKLKAIQKNTKPPLKFATK